MSNAIKKEFGSERNIIISLPHLAFEQSMELDLRYMVVQVFMNKDSHLVFFLLASLLKKELAIS